MAASTGNNRVRLRLLGLGNEILADDALGIIAAWEAERLLPGEVEVVCTSETGFNLLDYVQGTRRLVVVDTVETGRAEPGTIYKLREEDLEFTPGAAPHRIGLFETLALARKLNLPAPRQVTIIAVEAADCLTVGGVMTPAVRAAIPKVLELIKEIVRGPVE